ncbi:beta-lactamase family protein [Streptomyces sp. HU2014]|uniref:serine hydrolase domain-containing protein n=1 Tax=Streptomyces sp. HU2014 TaxID=2939414 RepID=UPI00200BF234|nr:serine hydrolase domain-containing protein [Streptomyces sp. HU2014]UQI45484.1 beta-lactamase family protein [Streptomyces sp. HU2014]
MGLRTVRTTLAAVAAAAIAGAALLAPPAASAAPARPGAVGGHERTRAAVDAAVDAGVPGVLARARDTGGAWWDAAGVADGRTERPPAARDRFRAGSISKTFVATVVLQLEAEGRLSIDDTVEKWLPEVVRGNGNDGRKITLRQLLNHTSGIFEYTGDPAAHAGGMEYLEHRFDSWKPPQLVALAMKHEPYFAPGTDWKYSNTNYVLAAMAVERVTGHPYETEARQRILEPLGLRSTVLPGTDTGMPAPAGRAYTAFPDDPGRGVHDVTEINPSLFWADGDLVTSAADLDRFYTALLRGRLLPPAQMKEMTTAHPLPGDGPFTGYGLGLARYRTSCGTELWGHNGSVPGTQAMAFATRDAEHLLVTYFNTNVFLLTSRADDIADAEFC